MTNPFTESEAAYRRGYKEGRSDYLQLQTEYDKVFNENRELRKANKELFDELARLKRGSISNWIPND